MRNRLLSLTAFTFALSAGVAVTACASSKDDQPAPFPTVDKPTPVGEEVELQGLDVAFDEPIAEENPTPTLDENGEAADEQDVTGAIFPNPIPDDPADAPAEADDPFVGEDAVSDGGLGTRSLRPLAAASGIPDSEKRVNVGSTKTCCRGTLEHCKLPDDPSRTCVCEGSPLNCQLPNSQPGRNRYIPTSSVPTIKNAGTLPAKVNLIDKLGRWGNVDGTDLFDGNGVKRSTSVHDTCFDLDGDSAKERGSGACLKINFGQRKVMKADGDDHTRTFLYAFAAKDGNGKGVSSWVRQSSIKSSTITDMPTVKNPTVNDFVATSYVVKSAEDWDQTPETFSSDDLPAFAKAQIAKGGTPVRPPLALDYLLRDGNVINLVYQTPGIGGMATDTFKVAKNALGFKRVKSTLARPTLVRVKLDSAEKPAMLFAYGSIAGRFGWLALDSFKKGDVQVKAGGDGNNADGGAPPAAPDTCVGKPDGTFCSNSGAKSFSCDNGQLSPGVQCGANQRCTSLQGSGLGVVCVAQ